jgi:hypothetical protein
MNRCAPVLNLYWLALLAAACDSGPPSVDPAEGARVAGDAGAARSDGGAGPVDGPPFEVGPAADGRSPDRPGPAIAPPVYPPAGTFACAPGCGALRTQYAEALLRAQRCTSGAAAVCALEAPGSLGCAGCAVRVDDLSEVAPLADRFNQMGCYGCYFGGPAGQNRCQAVGCADLPAPLCTAAASGQGSCTTQVDRTCPPGTRTGTPCDVDGPDFCISPDRVCFCTTDGDWGCRTR